VVTASPDSVLDAPSGAAADAAAAEPSADNATGSVIPTQPEKGASPIAGQTGAFTPSSAMAAGEALPALEPRSPVPPTIPAEYASGMREALRLIRLWWWNYRQMVEPLYVRDFERWIIGRFGEMESQIKYRSQEPGMDTERIAAMYAACAGLSTEQLVRVPKLWGSLQEHFEECDRLRQRIADMESMLMDASTLEERYQAAKAQITAQGDCIADLRRQLSKVAEERDAAQEQSRLGAITQALNKDRSSEDCRCTYCEQLKDKTQVEEPDGCPRCGFVGRQAAIACACYDDYCYGAGAGDNGRGCFHGALSCPVCDDGETDAWEIVREIRAIVTGDVASQLVGEGEGDAH